MFRIWFKAAAVRLNFSKNLGDGACVKLQGLSKLQFSILSENPLGTLAKEFMSPQDGKWWLSRE